MRTSIGSWLPSHRQRSALTGFIQAEKASAPIESCGLRQLPDRLRVVTFADHRAIMID
jgi:hypothetical protein